MKPCLLFDFDGTVANSIDEIFHLINSIAPRYGYPVMSHQQFAVLRNLPLTKAFRLMKLPLYQLGQAIRIVLHEYRRIIPDLEPCEGIVDALYQMKSAGVGMALISSNHTENVEAFLRHHSINCFDWVEGTNGIMQKHSRIIRQIKKHRLERSNVIYIGDETRDIKAARKSKIRIISVTWGLHSAQNLQRLKPDFLVNTPQEITDIVLRLMESDK